MKNFTFSNRTKNVTINNSLKLIDIKDNKECWFQCLHGYSIFYKTPIQIINSQCIIDRLLSIDSSIVGAVCGEVYKGLTDHNSLKATFSIQKNDNSSYYKLLFINRDGSIEYETTDLKRYSEKSILDLAQNKEIIKNFSPSEAYYIGFLAGLELYKIKNNLKPRRRKRQHDLKLIYSNSKL